VNLLRKFLIAAIVGAAAFVTTTLAHQVPAWSWLLSVFVSGVTLVVQFLVDVDGRLALLRREVFGIAEAGKLFELPSSGPLSRGKILQLVKHVSVFDAKMPALAFGLADAEVERVSNFLRDMAHVRQVTYDGDDWYWCMSLTIHARNSMDAMTLFHGSDVTNDADDDLWQTELGQRYLRLQADAVGRGVRVRRLFVVENYDFAKNSRIRQHFDQQHRLGIQVRFLAASNLPSTARTITPMVIFDDTVVYEQTTARLPSVPGYVKTTLQLQEPKVQAMTKQFQQLWPLGQFELDHQGG
jgi:hypothetical protein